ncbi:N-acetyltransferase [Streptomyces sp. CC224B]|uniref:N-acetyltransferase n=1 Tax=Streptomyces sp. CC224B TaxID=3044571 RepID=UPI0024A8DC8E|nr:N-acetyltransferase [Streptomyces sp. CC224B]
MDHLPFVPDDFTVPLGLVGDGFRLEPLGPRHNEADHAAWTSSIAYIRSTADFRERSWPSVEGMSLADNLRDLEEHAADFAARRGFTYTVLSEAEGDVVGCLYIYPGHDEPQVAVVRSWVRADRRELDGVVRTAVAAWLEAEWPFAVVRYRSGV